ncbi:MAG: hypothetical protein LBD92_07375 [Oscillospiraceae bacterium]|nr:hypothetical protein [Oscillospiraceae bacterium]
MSRFAKRAFPRRIYKVRSSRLRDADWALTLTRTVKDGEVVALGDSQILRWIDEMNGKPDISDEIAVTRADIRALKRMPNSTRNKRLIGELYEHLEEMLFVEDYLCVVMDTVSDYRRAIRGFTINGIKYVRLLGTSGGIKNSVIVFVSERVAPEIKRRVENGRDASKTIVPAKLEAYRALVCSGTTAVSLPRMVVVKDCETSFRADVVEIRDGDSDGPRMELLKSRETTLNASDGFGLMAPSLAERWSRELGLDYVMAGANTRYAFEKGMVFTFDFIRFADEVAGTRVITDAWGDERDLSDVELILTVSQVKLWEQYAGMEHYLACCDENGYEFGIAKTTPGETEDEHALNYQFIQSYDFDDAQLDALIAPTVDMLHDVLGLDWRKTVLFLCGQLNDRKAENADGISKALMIEPELINDDYMRKRVLSLIKRRIETAKTGVVNVRGHYSVASGDPYSLCQSVFGMPVTGLLKAGEIYNWHWLCSGVKRVACFRAPMTCHNNIRLMNVSAPDGGWYEYMDACTILNSWDTAMIAMNGMDFDGDLIFTTDNETLISNTRQSPALMCVQNSAEKCVPSEDDIVRSNIAGFGDDIGKITNRITSMFAVAEQYHVKSRERSALEYRIMCGQHFQQLAIDKIKGIKGKPMPKYWYDRNSVNLKFAEGREYDFNMRIIADKKPYFMRYVYPELSRRYTRFVKNVNKKSLRVFRTSLGELLKKNKGELSAFEKSFIEAYYKYLPVSMTNCVVNRICLRFESEFDRYASKYPTNSYDYSRMKSGAQYGRAVYDKIFKLCKEYRDALASVTREAAVRGAADTSERRELITADFEMKCHMACPSSDTLCDIMLDMCVKREYMKPVAWSVCSRQIVRNLLASKGVMSYPVPDADGDIEYGGKRFALRSVYARDVRDREYAEYEED